MRAEYIAGSVEGIRLRLAGRDTSLLMLFRMVGERFDEDRCLQIASSLTFTTLLAIVPVVTILLTVATAFPVYSTLVEGLHQFVLANLVPSSVNAVAAYAARFSRNAAGLTAAGIFFLGVTALMLMSTIEGAFNDIWRVTWQRRPLRRIIIYAAALLAGPVLIGASLSLTSYLITLSLDLVRPVTGGTGALLRAVPWLLTTAALSLLYLVVPNREVATRDALVGGLVAGTLFELMKHGFGFYVTHFPTDKLVYGAFAMVPIFLLWIYLSWLVVLGGAVLAAELPEWREQAVGARYAPGSDFVQALRALELLWRAGGGAVSTARLHAVVKLRIDRLEWMLAALAQAGYVERTGVTGWRLGAGAGTASVRDVYRLFVFDATAITGGVEARIGALIEAGGAGLEVPLAEFFAAAV